MDMDKLNAEIEGVGRIDRVAEVFEIFVGGRLPFAKLKVKVLDRGSMQFHGSPNVAIKNPATGYPEWIGGSGESVEEALRDALRYFFEEVQQYSDGRALTEDDFAWADPEDF